MTRPLRGQLNRYSTGRNVHYRTNRRGIALVAVMVLFVISLTLMAIWAQMGIREQRQIESQSRRLQAVRLAEAGVLRAVARRAADPQYEAEIWSVPAEILDGSHAAEVRIRLNPTDDASTIRYEATARFPVDAVRRVQITRRIDIPNPTSGDET